MCEHAVCKVLIVDDSRVFRDLVRDGLRARFPRLEVMEAGNIAEGYRQAMQYRPELVLLDVRLPDGSGLELARRIRDELPAARVCICTSHDFPEYRQAATACGAAHFISKQGVVWSETERLIRGAVGGDCSDCA